MESSAGIDAFMAAIFSALHPEANSMAFVIYDKFQQDRLTSTCEKAGLVIDELTEILHREDSSTGRIVLKLARKRDGDTRQGIVPPVHSLVLHPQGTRKNFYNDELENFLNGLPNPVYDVGRLDYLGSPSACGQRTECQ